MSFLDIAGSVLKPIGDYFNKRQEIKAVEHQAKIDLIKAQGERQAKMASEGLAADAAWEMEFAKQAATSWKDEYELLLLSVPLILCFFKTGAERVHEGFAALSATPLWYQGLIVTIFLANYGIRNWRRNIAE